MDDDWGGPSTMTQDGAPNGDRWILVTTGDFFLGLYSTYKWFSGPKLYVWMGREHQVIADFHGCSFLHKLYSY